MQNYIAAGNTLTIPAAPRALNGGDGLVIGSAFGICVNDAEQNAEVVIQVAGTFALPKAAAGAILQGQRCYWSDTTHLVGTVASGNQIIGVAADAAADGAITVNVRLNANF